MRKAYINQIEYFLPPYIETNEDLINDYGEWTTEKIYEKTGIKQRHVSRELSSVDMAAEACRKLFSKIDRKKIDFLIFISETPDYIVPSSSCVLHGLLGLEENCGAIDINMACSGYIYGLSVAKGLVVSGTAENVLLVTSESYTKLINKKDKSTRSLFGDAATATVVSSDGDFQIIDFDFGTRGSDYDRILVPAGGFKEPKSEDTCITYTDENGYIRTRENLYMDGPDVFLFSIDVAPKSIKKLLDKNGIGNDDVSRFILHQSSLKLLSQIKKKIGADSSKFEESYSDIGNTVSNSVVIALKRSLEKKWPNSGDNIVLCGYGAGLSWGSVLIRTKQE